MTVCFSFLINKIISSNFGIAAIKENIKIIILIIWFIILLSLISSNPCSCNVGWKGIPFGKKVKNINIKNAILIKYFEYGILIMVLNYELFI